MSSRYDDLNDDLHAEQVLDPSWQPVDVGPFLTGTIKRVEATLLQRDDGAAIFYAGRINWLHADSGTGKTFVAVIAAAAELSAGRAVVWIDYEEPSPDVLLERLLLVGVAKTAITAHLVYINPKVQMELLAVEHLRSIIQSRQAGLLVLDSLGEAFAESGTNEDKDNEVGPWCREHLRPLADAGAGVLVIDHATKAADNPLHPSGSKRKRAAVTGTSVLVEARVPLTRERGGVLRLVCAKDRHGTWRKGATIAELHIDIWPDGSAVVHVVAPDPAETAATTDVGLLRQLLEVLDVETAVDTGERPQLTGRQWFEVARVKHRIKGRDERFRNLAALAVHERCVTEQPGAKGSTLYRFVRQYTS